MIETLPRTRVAARSAHRFAWPAALALHLLPSAATFAAAMALGPVMRTLSLPPQFALTLAVAFVLTPIELGLLLHAAHRVTGRWSLRALPAVLSFRRRLPLRMYLVVIPSLTAVSVGLLILLEPVEAAIMAGYPQDWRLPAGSTAFPTGVLVATLLFTLVVEGLVNPAVEELYLRAYLLPRLPVRGASAVVTSAALFAAQHCWQPERFAFVLVAQLVLITVMLRLDSVRMSIAVRCVTNSLGVLLGLAAVLV